MLEFFERSGYYCVTVILKGANVLHICVFNLSCRIKNTRLCEMLLLF